MGDRGSGAVFFAHCPLQCVYCQNRELVNGAGIEISPQRLGEIFLELQNYAGAANINLVTPTHYVPTLVEVLEPLRQSGSLHIPVVYNTSSYDEVATLRLMEGAVDVYLADYKYAIDTTARELSRASHYPLKALLALDEMMRQVPEWVEDDQGLLRRGVIVRHLVLPGRVEESLRALDVLYKRYGTAVRLSIMSQYTPLTEVPSRKSSELLACCKERSMAVADDGADEHRLAPSRSDGAGDLARYGLEGSVSSEEYERVLDYADDLGFEDYFWQEGGAAEESFIPAFDGTGVLTPAPVMLA